MTAVKRWALDGKYPYSVAVETAAVRAIGDRAGACSELGEQRGPVNGEELPVAHEHLAVDDRRRRPDRRAGFVGPDGLPGLLSLLGFTCGNVRLVDEYRPTRVHVVGDLLPVPVPVLLALGLERLELVLVFGDPVLLGYCCLVHRPPLTVALL
jgi:hypothetical protein